MATFKRVNDSPCHNYKDTAIRLEACIVFNIVHQFCTHQKARRTFTNVSCILTILTTCMLLSKVHKRQCIAYLVDHNVELYLPEK